MRVELRGFTLIELLIALAILALLALLGFRAVAALSETRVRLAEEAQRWRSLDVFFAHLESDALQAVPRTARATGGTQPAFVATTDAHGDTLLTWSRAGGEFVLEPGSAGQRVGYRLRERSIELLYWPSFDTPADVGPTAYTLVAGVEALRVAYLDSHGAWRKRWPVAGEPVLPTGLRVLVQLDTGQAVERLVALR